MSLEYKGEPGVKKKKDPMAIWRTKKVGEKKILRGETEEKAQSPGHHGSDVGVCLLIALINSRTGFKQEGVV